MKLRAWKATDQLSPARLMARWGTHIDDYEDAVGDGWWWNRLISQGVPMPASSWGHVLMTAMTEMEP